ncbi:MAG: hypothetical protein R2788_10460 [Saprospiraceae bacterium]
MYSDWIWSSHFSCLLWGLRLPTRWKTQSGRPTAKRFIENFIRTLWIIGIGLLLSGAFKFNLATWRIPGVLTRIGLVYGICALIYMVTSTWQQLWVAVGCLLAYWGLMTLILVPAGLCQS